MRNRGGGGGSQILNEIIGGSTEIILTPSHN